MGKKEKTCSYIRSMKLIKQRFSIVGMRIALLIVIIAGILFCSVILYYIFTGKISPKKIYEINWKIQISSNVEQIYHKQNKHNFQRKGLRYTIYFVNNVNTLPLINIRQNTKGILVSEGNSGEGRDYDIEGFVYRIALELSIKEANKPIFDDKYYWQKFFRNGKTLVVVYFPNISKAYFAEEFI